MNKLIETWLLAQKVDVESEGYEQVSWAVDQLFDLSYDDPENLLEIIEKILEVESSQKILGALGSGVIEEILVTHGDKIIKNIEFLAERNSMFGKCLQYTYLDEDDVPKYVYQKFQAIQSQATK